jgi:hypothetical protein
MLIVIALIVFYNEFNNKLNIAEIALLIIALIAIIRAAVMYVQIDDGGKISEGFTNNNNNNNNRKHANRRKDKDLLVLRSEESDEYLDTEGSDQKNSFTNDVEQSEKDNMHSKEAIDNVNDLLGIKNDSESFFNLPTTTKPNPTSTYMDSDDNDAIKSVFYPQIIVGKNNKNSDDDDDDDDDDEDNSNSKSKYNTWNSVFKQDGVDFCDTMDPVKNLWKDPNTKFDTDGWNQNLNDYNLGKWRPNLYLNPSDYVDYYSPFKYGTTASTKPATTKPATTKPASTAAASSTKSKSNFKDIPEPTTTDEYGQSKKLCGAYDNITIDPSGELIVRNYTNAKKYKPGYTYVPPVFWDVPQKRIGICRPNGPNVRKLTGLIDRGLPLNVLELNSDGSIANQESDVELTNVGSMMPKFKYQEEPYSKPYV